MSTPMYDMPEHQAMPINAEGNGPEMDPDKVVAIICWCGRVGCTEFK